MVDLFTSPYFLLFARLCLGGVFIMSSIGKLLDQPGTAANLSRYPFLSVPMRRLIARVFPYIELVVGVLLVLGLFTRLAAVVSVGLYLVFTGLIAYDLSKGQDTSCHCFGKFSEEKLTPMAVVRNVALIVLAVLVAVAFDGWLALDSSIEASTNGSLGLVARGMSGSVVSAVDAVPIFLLALAAVGVIVLGGQAVSMVRTTLRGMGFR
ncbi:MAG: MauE/DoxX family redox-associated membrane protein [Chloroflexia bacterium]